MALLQTALYKFLSLSTWIRNHRSEVIIGAVFAVVIGVPAAIYFAASLDQSEPKPYKIYLVAGSHYLTKSTEDPGRDTRSQFESSKLLDGLKVGDVKVKLEIEELTNDKPDTAKLKAQELLGRRDTLLVIGHLDSEPTEASLSTYFEARPQVPFIASVQTDDELLKKACPDSKCFDGTSPLPFLQLSPTNKEQAHWAVRFATERNKRHFLIVQSNNNENETYAKSLVDGYNNAISDAAVKDSGVTKQRITTESLTREALREDLQDGDVDCVLYAGGFDDVDSLLKRISDSGKSVMVILGDSVVERRLNGAKLHFSPVHITDQSDAADYEKGISVYGMDAIAIAAQLIRDLANRGLDFEFRSKAWLKRQTVEDARRNLVRVMQENFAFRSSYIGAPDISSSDSLAVYAFSGYQRSGGMFHVWKRSSSRAGYEIIDVDPWHPKRVRFPALPRPTRQVAHFSSQ
jgi:hypothetical protein